MPIGLTGPVSFSAVYQEVFGIAHSTNAVIRLAKSNPATTTSLVANAAIGATFDPAGSTGPYRVSSFRGYSNSGATGGSVGIYLSNTSLDITISAMRVNGVAVGGSSFPVPSGENGVFYTAQFGTHDLEIDKSNSITGQHIGISDGSTDQCQNMSVGTSTVTFESVSFVNGSPVSVDVGDGTCS